MPRSKEIKKRTIAPDPVFQSGMVNKLINRIMKDGKKAVAQKQVYQALKLIEEKTKNNALDIFQQALENIKPPLEVRSRRVGGAAYQVPAPVRTERKESLAIRWLVEAARKRPNKEYHHFYEKLAAEILDAFNKTGGAIKKREDTMRIAEANRAFAHFRW